MNATGLDQPPPPATSGVTPDVGRDAKQRVDGHRVQRDNRSRLVEETALAMVRRYFNHQASGVFFRGYVPNNTRFDMAGPLEWLDLQRRIWLNTPFRAIKKALR